MTIATEQKHTPGPWNAEAFQVSSGRDIICQTGYSSNLPPSRAYEARANAQLIAQAPKLLAFAERIREACAVQANLLATASEADRSRFIAEIYALWNDEGRFVVAAATGKEAA